MEIYPLSEGSFTVDRSKEFLPFNKETDDLQQRPTGSLLVEVQPFLVKTEKELILFDSGLGFTESNRELQIHNNIRRAGLDPEDVSLVLMSHLHKDHAGGLQFTDEHGEIKLSFPGARYFIYKPELELALNGKSSSYFPSQFSLFAHPHPQLRLFEGESGELAPGIYFEHTGAHSPQHVVFRIEENKIAFFGGDVAPQLQQMKNRFVAKYDYDGRKSMQLRSAWWEKGASEHWTFMFYHDIKFPSFSF
jgi:glyoxylase-like metal-dependent hydrolase (beta-lactamase superfamily II)